MSDEPKKLTRGINRRSFVRTSGLTAGGMAAAASVVSPVVSFAQAPRAAASPSLSRQFARWAFALRFEELPPAVIDRTKGLSLQALASALLGSTLPGGQEAVKLVTEEEGGVRNGATLLVSGGKVTKGGAGFANSEMMLAGGKWDTKIGRAHV